MEQMVEELGVGNLCGIREDGGSNKISSVKYCERSEIHNKWRHVGHLDFLALVHFA